jgi:hypothetical protein
LKTFKEALEKWTDYDIAEYLLALDLGLVKEGDFQVRAKHIFNTDNKLGNMLSDILRKMEEEGILEYNEEETQFRWNAAYTVQFANYKINDVIL